MNAAFVYPPAHVGERELWELWGAGPTSYSQTTGDVILGPGVGEFLSCPSSGFLSQSGSYILRAFPSVTNNLRPTWAFRWLYSGTAQGQGIDGIVITTPGTGGTNGTATIAATGGGGTGATIQAVTAGGIITSVKVLNPGSGYTSVPTFTPAAGTGALTATVGSIAGMEVAPGTNLSAETVQFSAVGGQL